LPTDKTQSGIRTRSSPGGTAANYNEIRFEDKKGAEELYIKAEKDMNLVVGNNSAVSVGNDSTVSVARDLIVSAGNNFRLTSDQGVGINTGNDPAYALNVGGAVKATSFIGSGAGLTGLSVTVAGLPTTVAFLNSNHTFSAQATFNGPANFMSAAGVGIGTATPEDALLDVEGDVRLNTYDLLLREGADRNHGLGWYGAGKTFAGVNVDGPVLYGCAGGGLGTMCSTPMLALVWNNLGNVVIDPQGVNAGTLDHGLTFGTNSGQGIASRSSAGGNQFGLDFYTAGTNRLRIANNGNVGIGANAPTAMLDVSGDGRVRGLLRSGSETGTAEAPSPAGLVVRRVNSTIMASNSVVAVARNVNNTASLTLVRDGTAAGFQIQYPANPGYLTIACMGIDTNGVQRNFYTSLPSPLTAGTVQIYSNSAGVAHFECTFGITYNTGQHLTQVTLSRYGSDNYWSGTLMSTYNQ
jgi:hypothetical protein